MTSLDHLLEIMVEDNVVVAHCTDDESCNCRICREIHAGQRDATQVLAAVGFAAAACMWETCHDVMPDGRKRFIADHYWTGVYDVLSVGYQA